MKFLIYGVNFAPELTGIGKYSGDMAQWLMERGHTVRVVTAPPYYPEWKLHPDYKRHAYRRELWKETIVVWRTPLWVPKVPSGLTRILHLTSFAITSFPIMMRHVFWRPDVVLTVAPAFVCAPAGWLTAKLSGARAWLHLQDFEVDVAFNMGLMKGRFLQRAISRLERWLLRRFDSVSTISRPMVKRLIAKGVPASRVRLFPNWVDTARIQPFSTADRYREQLGLSAQTVIVLFSGSLGGKQGLMQIPAAAQRLIGRKDIAFVVCGDGVMKRKLEELSANLPNLYLLPLQPLERLGELLRIADIHLLPQSPTAADLVLPSKLTGMLASGRPVIATCHAGTELHSVVSRCGTVVPPEDDAALADAILSLADNASARSDLGLSARAWAETHFERNAVLSRMFNLDDSTPPIGDSVGAAVSVEDSEIADDAA
jgi:colanic acid biosynthesis glycosyl transferase WcaI